MSDITFPELQGLRIEMTDEVRDAQFQAIVAALAETPAERSSLLTRARLAWRRWVVSVAAVGTAFVPVAAVASESALPGDALYPLKLTVERIQVLFDRDIDAEHRVDELERLVAGDAPSDVLEDHIAETFDVLVDTADRPDLLERFDRAITDRRMADEMSHDAVSDTAETDAVGEDHRPAEVDSAEVAPADEPGDTTTTTAADRDATTTTVHRSDDRPTDTTEAPASDREPPPEDTTTTHGARDGDGERAGDGASDQP